VFGRRRRVEGRGMQEEVWSEHGEEVGVGKEEYGGRSGGGGAVWEKTECAGSKTWVGGGVREKGE
jgi:hypothetical protein